MHSITYANENTLINKPVGGWGGNVGANTRGDFDKKGWAQAGNLVITPTDQLYGPARPCNCHGFPLGGMGLEQAANVSRCSHGQPPVMTRIEKFEPVWEVARKNQQQELLGHSNRPVGSDLPYCAAGPDAGHRFRLPYGTSCNDKYFNSEQEARAGCALRTKSPLVGFKKNCKWVGGPGSRSRDGTKWFCGDGQMCRDHLR